MGMLPNPKHERFAQEIASGKTQGEAYEAAGYKAKDHAAEANGNRLLKNAAIEARVQQLLGRVAQGLVLTKQWVIERLIENADRAMQAEAVKTADGTTTGEYRYEGSVANRALELLGKEIGMFVDRKEVRSGQLDDITPDELGRLRQELVNERSRRANANGGPAVAGVPSAANVSGHGTA